MAGTPAGLGEVQSAAQRQANGESLYDIASDCRPEKNPQQSHAIYHPSAEVGLRSGGVRVGAGPSEETEKTERALGSAEESRSRVHQRKTRLEVRRVDVGDAHNDSWACAECVCVSELLRRHLLRTAGQPARCLFPDVMCHDNTCFHLLTSELCACDSPHSRLSSVRKAHL